MATGNMTQVDLVGLQKAINVFSNGVANFDNQYRAMSTTVGNIQAQWTGQAYQAFDRALQSWLTDFSKVISVLNGMENALAENTKVLTSTNEETIAAAQRAAAGIQLPTLPGF
ncbi:WXG100 family type VII secretion target [Streptomyces canus]|uniref:WXG100 family type VII secretion target n=1 Tax=Streptomyces canus TaxID=58343 RepID=UPI002E29BC64|nr:WXG100 family type VII secretion target [Streptomyces canus]